ncbi:hypothetical protein K1719_025393 [Acacia pycnantha]|nr:hypothetical protein K1719_025393 [Acacia pycnantha]
MAFCASFTPQSSLLCARNKPNPLSPTTSLLPTQVSHQKLLYLQPLRYNKRVAPIGVSQKRLASPVTASLKWEKGYTNVEVFTKDHLAVSLAYDVAQLSTKFIKERGAFTVALSGGSLIKYLRKLVEAPYAESIEWSKWHVFWVDERVVPKTHLESNYKLAYDGFISKVPIPGAQVYAIDDALPPDGAADVCETNLRRLVKSGVIASTEDGIPRFDLILLGMGPDGHVASLFPGHRLLREDQKWVSHLTDSPKPPPQRITYTLPVINSASNISMVVAGAGKANAVRSALEGDEEKLPIQLVSPRRGEIKWYLDKGAASGLFKE